MIISPEDALFRKQFNEDLLFANNKCNEIKEKIKSYGNLNAPTIDVAREVVRECCDIENRTGFLFFLLAFGITPHPTRGKVMMRESIYPWQLVASISFLSATKFISKKNRQTGATSFSSIYFLWRSLFFGNTNSFILSLGARESSDVLARVTFIYQNLPTWLKTPLLEGAKTSITFKNNSRVVALPGTPEALRGRSSTAVLLDEFAFLKDSGRILSAAIPSLSMGFLTPFSNDSLPSQLFVISTLPLVDSESNEYLRLYRSALQGDSDFKVIYIPPDGIPEYENEDWHKSMLEALGQKRYNVEILGILNSSLDNSFLPEHILANLSALQPIRTDFLKPDHVDEEGYAKDMSSFINSKEHYDKDIGYIKGLWIWRDPLPGRVYGVSVDVSAGVGGDYSAIQIIDIEDGYQVAEYYSNRVPLEDFKFIIQDIAVYYNNALLSIERNSIGGPLCSYFYNGLNYEGFYIHRHSKNKYEAGFPLTSGNKGNMLAALQKMFSTKYFQINSIRTINELRNFGFNGKGSICGLNGVHDDLVLALAQFSYLKETFFIGTGISDWDEDFIRSVEAEEEKIRNKHYSNINSDSRGSELENLFKGYAINNAELEEWKKMNQSLYK